MKKGDKIAVSKMMSYALRHNPEKFGLILDEQGWADFKDLMKVVSQRYPEVTEEFVLEMIDKSERKRFEIEGGKIRATYGHSIPVILDSTPVKPPEVLYHGTSRETVNEIKEHGLRPMGRQYVHLSVTEEEARAVGMRRDRSPVILKIDAKGAHQSGIEFVKAGFLYLVKYMPAEFIKDNSG